MNKKFQTESDRILDYTGPNFDSGKNNKNKYYWKLHLRNKIQLKPSIE